ERPVLAARRISGDFEHEVSLARKKVVPHPADEVPPRCEPGRARWVPCRPRPEPGRTRAPFAVMLVQLVRRDHVQGRAPTHYTHQRAYDQRIDTGRSMPRLCASAGVSPNRVPATPGPVAITCVSTSWSPYPT